MDDKSNLNTIFSWLHPPNKEHLSVYSQMVMCDQKDSPHSGKEPSNPFVNFKIKIVNDSGRKRKLVDYKNNDYNSPYKEQCSSNALSPDLGCFMDYSSSRNNSMSPFAPLNPTLKEETPAYRREGKETVSSRLDLENVQCGYSKDEVEKTKTILNDMSSVFDYEIDDIFCLNPPKQEEQEPTSKEENPDAGVVEDDKGYVSSFHLRETEEYKTEGPPEQQGHELASACGQHFSFLLKDDSKTVSAPLLGPVKCDGDFLEGEEEVLNIGQPIFESSVCQPAVAAEQKNGPSEALKGPINLSHTYNCGDFSVDTLYETTLPLLVQVKSKVVVPSPNEWINKPASSSTQSGKKASSADQNRDNTVRSARVHRPQILDNSMEWEHQKRQYIFSVRSHMNENPGGAQGPMTELLDLMTHVAGQTRANGHQWQHPSDLTCRNYQKRFRNETPTMTLSDWQAQNQIHHRRFSKVPNVFKRSQFP